MQSISFWYSDNIRCENATSYHNQDFIPAEEIIRSQINLRVRVCARLFQTVCMIVTTGLSLFIMTWIENADRVKHVGKDKTMWATEINGNVKTELSELNYRWCAHRTLSRSTDRRQRTVTLTYALFLTYSHIHRLKETDGLSLSFILDRQTTICAILCVGQQQLSI